MTAWSERRLVPPPKKMRILLSMYLCGVKEVEKLCWAWLQWDTIADNSYLKESAAAQVFT